MFLPINNKSINKQIFLKERTEIYIKVHQNNLGTHQKNSKVNFLEAENYQC